MTGKTHAACGAATMLALTVLHRSGLPIGAETYTPAIGLLTVVVGSYAPDVDLKLHPGPETADDLPPLPPPGTDTHPALPGPAHPADDGPEGPGHDGGAGAAARLQCRLGDPYHRRCL